MNVLLIGSGGREHALAWKISQSEQLSKLFIANGNAGTVELGENANLDLDNFDTIREFVLEKNIEMVVVGPEQALVDGLKNYFLAHDDISKVRFIGPGQKGANLEGSKDFAKEFMRRHNIPTADYRCFNKGQFNLGRDYLKSLNSPYVLKADGLAAGKGVIIHEDLDDACQSLEEMLSGKFGEASETVVIEEFLKGIEVSVFILTDGKSYVILPEAKDYKRINDGDKGKNTGGMGAVSPVPFANEEFMKKVEEQIIQPTITGLFAEDIDYKGFIFFGLMNVKGEPYVIEYNVRLGDPEAEAILPRIKTDLLDLFCATSENNLGNKKIEISDETVCTVMLVSGGYPDEYKKGISIDINKPDDKTIFFHAGTKETEKGAITSGGRVIAVSSFGKDIEDARNNAYKNVNKIKFDKMNFRKDIGKDLM